MTSDSSKNVFVMNETNEVLRPSIPVGDDLRGIPVNDKNDLVYVASGSSKNVSVMDPYLNQNANNQKASSSDALAPILSWVERYCERFKKQSKKVNN